MNAYDQHAEQYAALIHSRDEWGYSFYLDLVVPGLLEIVGQIRGKSVLDACCGEGSFTRLLARRGAHVVGIDISANLIAMAECIEEQEKRGIAYSVHDLTTPLPQYAARFHLIACNLALNDVSDYGSFVENLSDMLKPGGVLAISMNNPYSAVIREKVENYFDSGESIVYRGLASAGVPAVYHHRTMEEYMHVFKASGLIRGPGWISSRVQNCWPAARHPSGDTIGGHILWHWNWSNSGCEGERY